MYKSTLDHLANLSQDTYIFQMEEDIALQSKLPKYECPSTAEQTPLDGTTPTVSGAATPVLRVGSPRSLADSYLDTLHTRLRRVAIAKEEEEAEARKGNTESERSDGSMDTESKESKENGQKT